MPSVTAAPQAVTRIAARIRKGTLPRAPDFTYSQETPFYPPRGAAEVVSFFFASVFHFYGLWDEDGRRFTGPLRGFVDGKEYRGEDYLWKVLWRSVQEDPRFSSASYQAGMTVDKMAHLFRNDSGQCPIPLLKSHAELSRAYGETLENLKWSPNKILESCREAPSPVEKLVASLAELPGYREDPLQRKSFLLAMILSNRPEHFLPVGPGGPPVLDRHHLRLALRWGALKIDDPDTEKALEEGQTLPPPMEAGIRLAAYDVFARVLRESGRTVSETYALFFGARDYCPETATPDCPNCFFAEACEKKISFIQPVVRTLNY